MTGWEIALLAMLVLNALLAILQLVLLRRRKDRVASAIKAHDRNRLARLAGDIQTLKRRGAIR